MEIEKKYLINKAEIPFKIENFESHLIEQAYLCTDPVVRVRKEDDSYYMTYKGRGLMAREEYNLPLNETAYSHLLKKADGNIITKRRYLIPFNENSLQKPLTIELDIFEGNFKGICLAEIEFESVEDAESLQPPTWFGKDVTYEKTYHNSEMSKQIFQVV